MDKHTLHTKQRQWLGCQSAQLVTGQKTKFSFYLSKYEHTGKSTNQNLSMSQKIYQNWNDITLNVLFCLKSCTLPYVLPRHQQFKKAHVFGTNLFPASTQSKFQRKNLLSKKTWDNSDFLFQLVSLEQKELTFVFYLKRREKWFLLFIRHPLGVIRKKMVLRWKKNSDKYFQYFQKLKLRPSTFLPLTPLVFRLNVVNAFTSEKSVSMKKIFYYVMKNQKFMMVNQFFFQQKVANLSRQHFFAIVVKAMGLGIWTWTCPHWHSSAIRWWKWHSRRPPSMAVAI